MDAFIGGAWRSSNNAEVLIGGVWRRLTRTEGFINGQWRSRSAFVPQLAVSASPSEISGFVYSPKPISKLVTTGPATATPTGGVPPYSYQWDGGNSPTQASTTFTRFTRAGSEVSVTFSVTVTDSVGSAASSSVFATFTNQSDLGG